MHPVRIEIPLPLPIGSANAWLFPGDEPLLVDCGIGTPDGLRALAAGLHNAEVDFARLRLVVTHGHIDHAGNARHLADAHRVPLHAPASERLFLESFVRDAPRRQDAFARALATHGTPPDVIERVRERARTLDAMTQDTPISHMIQDGDALVAGSQAARVHLAPGHTPGSLLVATDTHLVTGDTLLEHITSNAIELLDRDRGRYAQYLRTLDGLRRFVGLTALPGHHEPFLITDALLDKHMEKHRARSRKVLSHIERPRTAWSVMADVLPHLAHGQEFLGMCEVVGHLHALVDEGQARESNEGGLRTFVRA